MYLTLIKPSFSSSSAQLRQSVGLGFIPKDHISFSGAVGKGKLTSAEIRLVPTVTITPEWLDATRLRIAASLGVQVGRLGKLVSNEKVPGAKTPDRDYDAQYHKGLNTVSYYAKGALTKVQSIQLTQKLFEAFTQAAEANVRAVNFYSNRPVEDRAAIQKREVEAIANTIRQGEWGELVSSFDIQEPGLKGGLNIGAQLEAILKKTIKGISTEQLSHLQAFLYQVIAHYEQWVEQHGESSIPKWVSHLQKQLIDHKDKFGLDENEWPGFVETIQTYQTQLEPLLPKILGLRHQWVQGVFTPSYQSPGTKLGYAPQLSSSEREHLAQFFVNLMDHPGEAIFKPSSQKSPTLTLKAKKQVMEELLPEMPQFVSQFLNPHVDRYLPPAKALAEQTAKKKAAMALSVYLEAQLVRLDMANSTNGIPDVPPPYLWPAEMDKPLDASEQTLADKSWEKAPWNSHQLLMYLVDSSSDNNAYNQSVGYLEKMNRELDSIHIVLPMLDTYIQELRGLLDSHSENTKALQREYDYTCQYRDRLQSDLEMGQLVREYWTLRQSIISAPKDPEKLRKYRQTIESLDKQTRFNIAGERKVRRLEALQVAPFKALTEALIANDIKLTEQAKKKEDEAGYKPPTRSQLEALERQRLEQLKANCAKTKETLTKTKLGFEKTLLELGDEALLLDLLADTEGNRALKTAQADLIARIGGKIHKAGWKELPAFLYPSSQVWSDQAPKAAAQYRLAGVHPKKFASTAINTLPPG